MPSTDRAENRGYVEKFELNSNNQPVYHGQAAPGTATSKAFWRIRKFTYNANGVVTDIQWASGNADFDKEWDERATYTYS